MLHNKIADFHNYIDNLKTEIDNLNTDIQFAKKEVIEKETHAKQIEKEEIQRKKEENDAKKIKLKSTGKKSQLVNKLDMKEKSKEKSPEIIKEKSKGKSQEKSQEKNQEKIRENSKERSPEKSKEKSPEKIHDISPNFHLYNTNFITDPGEDVVQLNDTLNDISNKIFGVIGIFTKKYPHRIILKGGKAIQVLASTILPGGVNKKKYTYLTNDIDVIVIPSASGHTSEHITDEMIEYITNMFPQYPEKVISGENNQKVNGKDVNTMKIIYKFTQEEPQLYNKHLITQLNILLTKQGKPEIDYNPHGFKGSESLLDVTFSETETIDFYQDKTLHDCHRMNEGQTICSQSIESILYERLYYIDKYSNKQTELAVTENLFLKKIKKSFLYLLILYTYQMTPSPKDADTIYKDVHSIQNYSEGKPMYKVLSGLINNYPEKDNMTFNNVFDKVILPNLVSKENLEKLKKIRDELIKFNNNPGLNTTIKQNVKKLIENYYDHDYLTQKKAFVEVGIKDKKLKEEFNQIIDIYYEKE